MPAICVSLPCVAARRAKWHKTDWHGFSSVYQDIPLYSIEEFKRLAPEPARTDEVLEDEHQLMLNRLSFELAERQR